MSRAFFVQLKREFAALLYSPIAWIIFFCVSLLMGIIFTLTGIDPTLESGASASLIMPRTMGNVLFWMVFPICVTLVTMRTFSEEFKSGTIEPLLTAPVTDWDVILAKFFAALFVLLIAFLSPFFYFFTFQYVSGFQVPTEWGQISMMILIIVLITMFYSSIGIFCSSLTRNQIIAAILCFCAILVLFMIGILSYVMRNSIYKEPIEYFFAWQQLFVFSQAIFDTRALVFNLTGTAFFLILTQRVMAGRRLKG